MCYKKFVVAQAIVVAYYFFLMVLGYYLGSSRASPSASGIGPMLRGCFRHVNITVNEESELGYLMQDSASTAIDEDLIVVDDDGFSLDTADIQVGDTNEKEKVMMALVEN